MNQNDGATKQIERPEVGYDFGSSGDIQSYRCVCGWETDQVGDLAAHLSAHGAIAVTVTPMNRRPAR